MITSEYMVLLVGALLASVMVASLFISYVSQLSGGVEAENYLPAGDYEVVSVEGNSIYIRGVEGRLPLDVAVWVDSVVVEANVTMLRDLRDRGYLNPDDMAVVVLPVNAEGKCIKLRVGGVYREISCS